MLQKIGRLLVLFLIGFLPWSVIVSVFGTERLGIELFRFTKEVIIGIILLIALLDAWKKRYKVAFDRLDVCIVLYIVTLLVVSLFTQASPT